MNVKALLYVKDLFNITGRGPLAAVQECWSNSEATLNFRTQNCLLLTGSKAPIPFKSRGFELAGRIIGGVLLPQDLEVPQYSHILVLADEV